MATTVALLLTACQPSQSPPCPGSSLTVAATQVCVEIVETPEDVGRGLSGRESLGPSQGMLFMFQNSGAYAFWMKDMRFPLDFVWIADGEVIDLTENVPVPTGEPLPLYRPRAPVTWVLEVKAGFVAQHRIKIGDKVTPGQEGHGLSWP